MTRKIKFVVSNFISYIFFYPWYILYKIYNLLSWYILRYFIYDIKFLNYVPVSFIFSRISWYLHSCIPKYINSSMLFHLGLCPLMFLLILSSSLSLNNILESEDHRRRVLVLYHALCLYVSFNIYSVRINIILYQTITH